MPHSGLLEVKFLVLGVCDSFPEDLLISNTPWAPTAHDVISSASSVGNAEITKQISS